MRKIHTKIAFFIVSVFCFFTSCDNSPKYGFFEISGIVTDSLTSAPIQNIRIVREGTDFLLFGDTILTDSNGHYSFTLSDYYTKKTSFSLKIEDIDKEQKGGEYVSRKVKVPFTGADWLNTNGISEYDATASKVFNIKLQLKQP